MKRFQKLINGILHWSWEWRSTDWKPYSVEELSAKVIKLQDENFKLRQEIHAMKIIASV